MQKGKQDKHQNFIPETSFGNSSFETTSCETPFGFDLETPSSELAVQKRPAKEICLDDLVPKTGIQILKNNESKIVEKGWAGSSGETISTTTTKASHIRSDIKKASSQDVPGTAVDCKGGALAKGQNHPAYIPFKGMAISRTDSGGDFVSGIQKDFFGSAAELVWSSTGQQVAQHTVDGHRTWGNVKRASAEEQSIEGGVSQKKVWASRGTRGK